MYLSFLILLSQLFKHGLKLLLLLLSFLFDNLVLLVIGHSYNTQDQVDQIEGTKEYYKDKKDHIWLPRCPQSLEKQTRIWCFYSYLKYSIDTWHMWL